MQNSVQLEQQVSEATALVTTLQKAADGLDTLDSSLANQTQLDAAQRVLERLQRQLGEAQQREENRRKEEKRLDAQAAVVANEAEHTDLLAAEAFIIDQLALRLEEDADQTAPLVSRAAGLRSQHPYLLHKLTGEWPDEFKTALPRSAPPTQRSRLYEVAQFALMVARDTEADGPLSLDIVMAHINAATRPAENYPPRPTPPNHQPIDETGLDIGQRMAHRRRGLGPD